MEVEVELPRPPPHQELKRSKAEASKLKKVGWFSTKAATCVFHGRQQQTASVLSACGYWWHWQPLDYMEGRIDSEKSSLGITRVMFLRLRNPHTNLLQVSLKIRLSFRKEGRVLLVLNNLRCDDINGATLLF